jgi:hypothetical protein
MLLVRGPLLYTWVVLTFGTPTEGELVDLIEDFSEGRVQFAFVKVKDPNTTLPKYVLIGWVSCGIITRDHIASCADTTLAVRRGCA